MSNRENVSRNKYYDHLRTKALEIPELYLSEYINVVADQDGYAKPTSTTQSTSSNTNVNFMLNIQEDYIFTNVYKTEWYPLHYKYMPFQSGNFAKLERVPIESNHDYIIYKMHTKGSDYGNDDNSESYVWMKWHITNSDGNLDVLFCFDTVFIYSVYLDINTHVTTGSALDAYKMKLNGRDWCDRPTTVSGVVDPHTIKSDWFSWKKIETGCKQDDHQDFTPDATFELSNSCPSYCNCPLDDQESVDNGDNTNRRSLTDGNTRCSYTGQLGVPTVPQDSPQDEELENTPVTQNSLQDVESEDTTVLQDSSKHEESDASENIVSKGTRRDVKNSDATYRRDVKNSEGTRRDATYSAKSLRNRRDAKSFRNRGLNNGNRKFASLKESRRNSPALRDRS